jgi:hypothetical protein
MCWFEIGGDIAAHRHGLRRRKGSPRHCGQEITIAVFTTEAHEVDREPAVDARSNDANWERAFQMDVVGSSANNSGSGSAVTLHPSDR